MSTDEQAWFLPAYAKINLGLRVLGRRPDGYHEIDTWMHAIALCDDLWVRAHSGASAVDGGDADVQVEISADSDLGGMQVSADGNNLVVRAAQSFLEAAGLRGRVRLEFALHKRIPAGGGLGGGSADAAAALRLSNVACGEPLTAKDLHGLATQLGADVPFFLAAGTQRAQGIGERLEPLRGPDAPRLELVLIMPTNGTSTADVYRALQIDSAARPAGGVGEVPGKSDGPRWHNDLEETAMQLDPGLGKVRDRALELGAESVRLSGSGSTMFVACSTRAARDLTRQALAPLTAELGARVRCTSSAPLFGPPRRAVWRAPIVVSPAPGKTVNAPDSDAAAQDGGAP